MIDKAKIEEAISQIRPNLQSHGGDISLAGVTDGGVVQVRLRGACSGCPGAAATLKMGVERVIRELVPEVRGVESVE
jgi:Fe-S cluster biogenesis protein NfuA